MESKNLLYKGRGYMEDAHAVFESSELKVYSKVDSNEKIFSFKYLCDDLEICEFLSAQHDKIIDSSLDKIEYISSENISENKYNLILSHLVGLRDIYIGNPGSLKEQGVDSSDILCFCSKTTYNGFKKVYDKSFGNRKKTMQETLVSSFCSSCSTRAERYIESLESDSDFFMGKSKTVWSEKLSELLNDFYMFCPAEYSQLKFEVLNLKYNIIRIKCSKEDSGLKRMEIQKTLENFLLSEIDEDVKISVIT